MHKILFFSLFLVSTSIHAQGIFFETDWKTAINKAKLEKKLVFIDFYTTWCKPCKVYDQTTFQDSAVGQFFNTNFINLKCNAEKGWGVKAAKHYDVYGYPTFLFIHPENLEVYYVISISPLSPNDLIRYATTANQERNSPPLSILNAEYEKGKREEGFFKNLIKRKCYNNLDFTQEFFEYIRLFPVERLAKEAFFSPSNIKVTYGSQQYQQLKRYKFSHSEAQSRIEWILKKSIYAILDTATQRKDPALMERMLQELANLEVSEKNIEHLRINFYLKIEDFKSAFNHTETYLTSHLLNESIESIRKKDSIDDADLIQGLKTRIKDSIALEKEYEHYKSQAARYVSGQIDYLVEPLVFAIKDKEQLKKMLKWSSYANALEPYASSSRTHCILLYRNGEVSKAISAYTKTIEWFEKFTLENDGDNFNDRKENMKKELEKMKRGVPF